MPGNCTCSLENKSEFVTIYKHLTKEDEQHLGKMEIHRCLNCSLAFANPQPDISKLEYYYDKIYRKEGRPNFISNPEKTGPGNLEKSQYAYIAKYVNLSNINSILDIGAGYGFFLREIRKMHSSIELFFDDLDIKSTQYLEKYNINRYDHKINNSIDLIISSHNLEHFTTPDAFFEKVKFILKPKGYLFIEVPNDSFDSKKSEEKSHYSPHLLFFSKKSLQFFMEKHGFRIINIETCGWPINTEIELLKSEMKVYKDQDIVKSLHNKFASLIPTNLKEFIRRKILNKSNIDLTLENFNYGGDRRAIRAIAVFDK